MNHRDASLVVWYLDLAIDERVVEAGGRGVLVSGCEENARRPRPKNSGQAHGTRLAGSVQVAAGKLEISQYSAGFPNGHHFGVSRRIVGPGHLISSRGDHNTISDDQCRKGSALAAYIFH